MNHNEYRLSNILESLSDGIWVIGGERRVLTTNPRGREYLELLTIFDQGDVLHSVGTIPFEQIINQREGVEVSAGADSRVFEIIARRLAGTDEECVVVVRDITRYKEDGKREERQNRLAALGQFAAGMAHDFNNLLIVTSTIAQILQRREDLPADARDLLGEIVSQGSRAEELVRQILDFSRRSSTRRQPLDLSALVHDAERMLGQIVGERVNMVIDAEDKCMMEGNPTQIQQVLANLALNARHAMPQGGMLRISVTSEEALPGERPQVLLRVSDGGEGMAPQTLERLFEPYFTTKQEGTGLGMSQAYGIVKQHRGEIQVESEVGAGTTVTIRLPMVVEKEELPAPTPETPVSGKGTVLLVEDRAAVRRGIRAMVEHLGYGVIEARTGAEGLDLYRGQDRTNTIDIIITDLVMPVMGGAEMIRRLRAEGAEVPILAMTGHPGEVGEEEPRPVGVSAVLNKPLRMDELVRALQAATLQAPEL